MPICSNCAEHIPNYLKINGKLRNLSKRKYCLNCSPFGKHNTKPFGYIKKTIEPRNCPVCGKSYSVNGSVCWSCQVNSRRFARKLEAIKYLGGACIRCGYSKCPAALTFHHRNPDEKEFSIGGSHAVSHSRFMAEIDKCDLLCQNCHAEEHWEQNDEKRQLMLSRINKTHA